MPKKGQILETLIDRFDGGMVNDARDTRENTCQVVTNFDTTTNPRKMTSYKNSEDGDSSASTSRKQNFSVALWTITSTWRVFGLGVQSGA